MGHPLLKACKLLAPALILSGYGVFAQSGSFTLYDAEDLDVTYGTACINSLSAPIGCNEYMRTMTALGYRSSLGNVSFTDEICSADCSSSLSTWFNSVARDCAGKELDGSVPQKLGGYMWAGYNETCIKDPRTKSYCNDIIANFTEVATYQDMPQAEICSTCYIRRLAMMQSSQYSIYDEYYKEELEYVYSKCGGSGPTDIPPPIHVEEPVLAPYCVSGKRYTTMDGDTCESISNSTGVSSAALYMGNQQLIRDCAEVEAGLVLCVPITCQTYFVRPSDTCTSIETAYELEYGTIRSYNSWIYYDCSNLQPGTDFYGKMICISPQGGTFTGVVPIPAPTDAPVGDGYTREPVDPPADAEVATGTTLRCGKWHVVAAEDTCTVICVQAGISSSLFRTVNPSLAGGSCTPSLRPGTAVCVGPTYTWNMTSSIPSAGTDGVTMAALPTTSLTQAARLASQNSGSPSSSSSSSPSSSSFSAPSSSDA